MILAQHLYIFAYEKDKLEKAFQMKADDFLKEYKIRDVSNVTFRELYLKKDWMRKNGVSLTDFLRYIHMNHPGVLEFFMNDWRGNTPWWETITKELKKDSKIPEIYDELFWVSENKRFYKFLDFMEEKLDSSDYHIFHLDKEKTKVVLEEIIKKEKIAEGFDERFDDSDEATAAFWISDMALRLLRVYMKNPEIISWYDAYL